MKLTICITHYKEPFEVVRPMLESLRIQRGIDWNDVEILIVQDGKEGILDPSLYEPYNLPIRALNLAKCGISEVRNRGLYEAKGDYIMWCDCDDLFYSMFGLRLIFEKIKDSPDIIGSRFIEENKFVSDYALIPHDNDHTFVHGKAFKIKFLRKQGMKFHKELTKHEDGVFTFVAYECTKNTAYIQTPFYLWAWNDNSVMRSIGTGRALISTYPELMQARLALLEDLKLHGIATKGFVAKCVLDSYYDFQKIEFSDPKNADKIEYAIAAFADFYKKYRDIYHSNDAETLGQIMMASRALAYKNGMMVERMTLNQFLTLIDKELNSGNAD